jgi:(4S)-4-hydroxy-5-phosphonooxypentane-2,3-dione isomerase
MYTVISLHKILPEHITDYIENMRICAEKTNREPGCIRYEVMQDVDDPTMMCLFQAFKDESAYGAHQESEHHRVWMELSGGWRDTSVRVRHQVEFITPIQTRAIE